MLRFKELTRKYALDPLQNVFWARHSVHLVKNEVDLGGEATAIIPEEPIQLIDFVVGKSTTIQLNADTAKLLVEQCGNRPLSIICICGPSRQGKSFILGYMIRCLEAMEKEEDDWMDWKNEENPLSGFKFRNGSKPETQGIWVWSRPFIVKNESGEEIAVLLIDTQGTYDEFTTYKDMSAIVGLSLLTSSVMIFNFFTNLQEDVLTSLNTYTSYGQLALEKVNDNMPPFQKLFFLIRDWNNPDEYKYGARDGKKFLDEKLETKAQQAKEAKEIRISIKKCFQEYDCFLMPSIGEKALYSQFTGSISELAPGFATKMEEFINHLINSETLTIKKVLGNTVNAEELFTYMENYIKIFNSKEVPSAESMWEATSDVHNGNMVKKACSVFHNFMNKQISDTTYFQIADLDRVMQEGRQDALDLFRNAKKFGTSKNIKEHEKKLMLMLEQEKSKCQAQNEEKRNKYIIKAFDDSQMTFKKRLENSTPFDGCDATATDFYEEGIIQSAIDEARNAAIRELKEKLKKENDETVTRKIDELVSAMVDSDHMNKNAVRRENAVKFFLSINEKFVGILEKQLKEYYERSPFANATELEERHSNAKGETLAMWKREQKPGSEDFQKEFQDKLEKNIQELLGKYYRLHKDKMEELKMAAKSCVKESQNLYEEIIKNETEIVRSVDELERLHQVALKEALKVFFTKFPAKADQAFVGQHESELKEDIKEAYEAVKDLQELKREKERAEIASLETDLLKFYHEQMEKHCQNTRILRPEYLDQLHKEAVRVTITKLEQTPLSSFMKNTLKMKMEIMYDNYKEGNYMKFNFAKGVTPAIGIDLGTTYCCVAVYYNGEVIIIPNHEQDNSKTTASYVMYNADGSTTVGNVAKEKAYENPENTIYDAKRIVGRRFDDPKLQGDMKYWPFEVVNESGIPKINVRGKCLFPQQVSAELLSKFRLMAAQHLGLNPDEIKKAVITVPAYFNDGQRQATVEAAKLAGLEVLTIFNEPTAAAIAYTMQRKDSNSRKVLIFDLGGGTFDVAVLNVAPGKIEVLGVDGDTHLGGEDFDQNLMKHCAQKFRIDKNIDLMSGKDSLDRKTREMARRRLKRLQTYCEKAKKYLTSGVTTDVCIDALSGSTDLNVKVSREDFEKLNMPLFQKTIEIVERALRDTKTKKEEIDDIVLVGGSTRIPKVRELLKTFFGGRALTYSINPDEAVAYGAAVKAAMMNGEQAKGHIDFDKIEDVTPMSLGIVVQGGFFSVIIPKNTKVPTHRNEEYTTANDYQTGASILVYQGEEPMAKDNELLGQFQLEGIPPAPRHQEILDIAMKIDSMGILHVEAESRGNRAAKNKITINENRMRMSKETMSRLIAEKANPYDAFQTRRKNYWNRS